MDNIVVFNALQTSLSGGIGRYSYELSKELYIQNPNKIKIVIRKEDISLFKFAKKKDLIVVDNIKNSKDRNMYEQFKLPKIIYKLYPDAIIHYPDSMAPLFAKNKVVITVHDLAFKSLKKVFTRKTILWKNFITNISVKKAERIIAITNFTKNELIKYYPKIDKKIEVAYNGFNDFSNDKIIDENIRSSIREICLPYILTVSTISPRKNIDGLIKAFNEIKNKISCNLVIAGANGWMYKDIFKLVNQLNLKDRVIFTGKINDDELKYLYKNSTIFTYLSFYEGFGLPPLEAMSYGIPCVVSNTASIPEVVDDSAIKVNPYDLEQIKGALLDVLEGNRVFSKSKLNKQINKFSWEICAKETKSIYDKVGELYEK